MRRTMAIAGLLLVIGCTSGRWQVVNVGAGSRTDAMLVDTQTGETWERHYERDGTAYWQKMRPRGAATQP